MSDQETNETSASRGSDDGQDPASTRSAAETTDDVSVDDAEPTITGSLEEQLDAARKDAAEHYDRFLRAKADIENILKRHQRELAERARYDGESLARDILPAVDDLERALEHAAEDRGSSVSGGVELVLKGLLAALKRHGVERIDALGNPFDPAEHEAVTMVETGDATPSTVMAVFRAGYRMRDRLLRAAMVSVSKPPEPKS